MASKLQKDIKSAFIQQENKHLEVITLALTAKQQRFVEEYLIDLNATQAAIRAGYSESTAKEMGYENLTKPHIQEKIQELMAERSARTQITADMVLREYAKIGFSDISNYLKVTTRERVVVVDGPEGPLYDKQLLQGVDLYDTDDIEPEKMHAVAEIRQTRDGIALKLHDKKGALDSISRHLGMFNDKVQVNGTISIENLLEQL